MSRPGPDEKIYPVAKIATIVEGLAAEGISHANALNGIHLSKSEISSPATRVSLNQIIEFYRIASRLSCNPRFAYHAGLRFHVSTYGMYGFAILSSTNFRQTMRFAAKYHELATPLADVSFHEEGDQAAWTIFPIPHPRIDAALYKFLVELQFGIHTSLHRDVMGPSFLAKELHVTYGSPGGAQTYQESFESRVLFNRPENKFVFDASWLDAAPKLGNEITYSAILKLCDELMEEFQLRAGVAGKVRELLFVNLMRPTSFNDIAGHLHMTTRTLRRRLEAENTCFRRLVDELRMYVAIKYLRDTDFTLEDIANALGFSDAANFRRAFRRWTNGAPHNFRGLSRGSFEVRNQITTSNNS